MTKKGVHLYSGRDHTDCYEIVKIILLGHFVLKDGNRVLLLFCLLFPHWHTSSISAVTFFFYMFIILLKLALLLRL